MVDHLDRIGDERNMIFGKATEQGRCLLEFWRNFFCFREESAGKMREPSRVRAEWSFGRGKCHALDDMRLISPSMWGEKKNRMIKEFPRMIGEA